MDRSENNEPLPNTPSNEEAAGTATETSGQPDLAAELATAKQEAAANFDRYTRAVADLENFRKRTLREKEELRQFATAGLMRMRALRGA